MNDFRDTANNLIPARFSREKLMPPCFIEGLADELGRQETRVPTRSPGTHQLARIADAASRQSPGMIARAALTVAASDRGRVCLFGAKALNGQRPRSVN